MQTVIVISIVGAAAFFFVRNLIQTYKGESTCSGSCSEQNCCSGKAACNEVQIKGSLTNGNDQ